MPPLIVLATAGAGVYFAAKLVKREMARVARTLEEAGRQPKPIEIRLEKDPTTGVYRTPKGPGEI